MLITAAVNFVNRQSNVVTLEALKAASGVGVVTTEADIQQCVRISCYQSHVKLVLAFQLLLDLVVILFVC
jgi:hypothetical protein